MKIQFYKINKLVFIKKIIYESKKLSKAVITIEIVLLDLTYKDKINNNKRYIFIIYLLINH